MVSEQNKKNNRTRHCAHPTKRLTNDLSFSLSLSRSLGLGHGGSEAATFAKEHLINLIVNQKLFWSNDDRDVLRAIREGYIATHYAMWREQGKRGVSPNSVHEKTKKKETEKIPLCESPPCTSASQCV